MRNSDWGYVALCLVAPLLWGVLSAKIFDWFEARLARKVWRERVQNPTAYKDYEHPDMYHI